MIKSVKSAGLLRFAAGVLATVLLVSCAGMKNEDKKADEKKSDRFAFLRKNEREKIVDKKETLEQEKVSPEKKPKPVISPEDMKKLGVTAAPEISAAELSAGKPAFYEDLIALNADEKLDVSLVFNSAPLLDVLSAFGDLLEFNFSADSSLNSTVTLNLNSKMTRRELWNTFDRMLSISGAGVKVDGSLLRVMPRWKLAQQPDSKPGHTAEIYYRQLHNATANEVIRQVRSFVSSGATCVELTRPNAVMVCDSPENMPKVRQIIEYLDTSGKNGWPRKVIPCNNVLPNKVANELQEILPVLGLNIYKTTDRTVAPGAVQIVGLDRMRLLVISAATQEAIDLVSEWIQLLDTAGSDDQENVFVYKVRHNKAAHLARALAVVFETQGTSLTTDATTGRTKIETINSPVTRNPARVNSRAASRSDAVNVGTNIQTDQDSKIFGTYIRVFADGVLNRLVLRCTPRTYASVKALLDKLDVVPAQVLLQVLMVEVTLTESTQFGLEFSGVAKHGNTGAVFGTNYSGNASAGNQLTPFITNSDGSTSFRTAGNRQDGFTLGIGDKNDPQKQFGYIRAQAGNGQVKVISSPQLLVSSHTEAKINVGQSVPTISGTLSSTDGGVSDSLEYKDTGVGLTVTPYVTSTNLISLDIVQTMSQATANIITPEIKSPVITKREIETSMTIANGQTMVLGGLIQERSNDSLDSIPIINKIPFLKRLLGSTNASVERTEVLVLITGYIVNEHSEVDALIRRYNDAVKALNEYDSRLGDRKDADKHRGVLFQDKEFWL
ncbi:MAG: hypothetical protein E7051_07445 [Lentisphaerae bacterium]|nr:hypothetical protein [Lentisphaerota bacterium]